MGAVGVSCGQLEHLRAEGGENGFWLLGGRRTNVVRVRHGFEIPLHGGYGFLISVSAHAFHERTMRDADSEQEPPAGLLGQSVLGAHHRETVAGINVGDPRRDVQLAGVRKHPRGGQQGVSTECFREPQRPVAPLLESLSKRCTDRCAEMIDIGPNTDFSDVHGSRLVRACGG